MIYLIEYDPNVTKQISKFDRHIQLIIIKKINELKEEPIKKGKHLKNNLYELRYINYRIYYYVFRGLIVIDNVSYEGKARLIHIGTKDTQKRDIRKL